MVNLRLVSAATSLSLGLFTISGEARPVPRSNGSAQTQFGFQQQQKPTAFTDMVVFGDSFSDDGNTLELSNGSWPEPLFYPDGRFSNGKVWADYVTEARRLNTTNFAYGGATTDSRIVQGYSGREADIPVPGFHQQLDQYGAAMMDGDADKRLNSTLFVVSFQGNDFIFDPTITTEQVLSNIERGVRRLIEEIGAQHLIVVENFDFGKIPFFLSNMTLSREKTALAQRQHWEYQELIHRLRRDYGGSEWPLSYKQEGESGNSAEDSATEGWKANIAFFDLFALFDKLHCPRQLRRLGIRDVDHGCVNDRATEQCKSPSEHFFYDSYHPSTKVHREVASGILSFI